MATTDSIDRAIDIVEEILEKQQPIWQKEMRDLGLIEKERPFVPLTAEGRAEMRKFLLRPVHSHP